MRVLFLTLPFLKFQFFLLLWYNFSYPHCWIEMMTEIAKQKCVYLVSFWIPKQGFQCFDMKCVIDTLIRKKDALCFSQVARRVCCMNRYDFIDLFSACAEVELFKRLMRPLRSVDILLLNQSVIPQRNQFVHDMFKKWAGFPLLKNIPVSRWVLLWFLCAYKPSGYYDADSLTH